MAQVRFSVGAGRDADRSMVWFEEQEPGVGVRFVQAVDAGVARLAQHPEIGPGCGRGLRRLLIRTFHHGIFYRVRGNLVEVLAVLDLRRDPREISRTLGYRASS